MNKKELNLNKGQEVNTNNEPKKKNSSIIKILAIIGGVFVSVIAIFVIIFSVVSFSSNKLICKSNKGNITIMYKENKLTGYTAKDIKYDFDQQNKYAQKVGIVSYLNEFEDFFKTNMGGSCTKKEK